jgi:hypothetical protein
MRAWLRIQNRRTPHRGKNGAMNRGVAGARAGTNSTRERY